MIGIIIIGIIFIIPLIWEIWCYRQLNNKSSKMKNELDLKIQCNNCRNYYDENDIEGWDFCKKCFELLINKTTNQRKIK